MGATEPRLGMSVPPIVVLFPRLADDCIAVSIAIVDHCRRGTGADRHGARRAKPTDSTGRKLSGADGETERCG